jgi:hypothetical protein
MFRQGRLPRIQEWRVVAVSALAVLAMAAGAPPAATQESGHAPACDEIHKLPPVAQAEVLAVARILALKPAMAIDFSDKTKEMCLNTGGPVMTHFSTHPEDTDEDIVYFVDAAPLVAKGLRLAEFPSIDPQQGKMKPGTWYRYEGKGTEPHHGMEMKDRTWLILATDVH